MFLRGCEVPPEVAVPQESIPPRGRARAAARLLQALGGSSTGREDAGTAHTGTWGLASYPGRVG